MAGIDIISDSTGKEIVAALQSTDVAQARILEINKAAELKKNEVLESIPEDYRNIADDISKLKSNLVRKLDNPDTAPAIGKILKIKQVNEDGSFLCEWADSGSVTDVQINGTSIVSDGVAEIPISGENKFGVVAFQWDYYSGINNNDGTIKLSYASDTQIENRLGAYAILSRSYDKAVKCAMTDGKGQAWTNAEKTGAWSRLNSIKTTMGEVAVAGAKYFLGELTELNITLPDDSITGQEITVSWYNGETPSTLSINGNMLDFNYTPSANTRSEISCLWDGTYWSVIGMSQDVPVGEVVASE